MSVFFFFFQKIMSTSLVSSTKLKIFSLIRFIVYIKTRKKSIKKLFVK